MRALILLLTLLVPIQSQSISIDGVVVRADTGKPIAGAKVLLTDASGKLVKSEQLADSVGRFTFRTVEPGRYQVTAGAVGFATNAFGSNSLTAPPTILSIDSKGLPGSVEIRLFATA